MKIYFTKNSPVGLPKWLFLILLLLFLGSYFTLPTIFKQLLISPNAQKKKKKKIETNLSLSSDL